MVGRRNSKTIFLTVEGIGDRAIDYGAGSTVADLAMSLTEHPPSTLQTLQVLRSASVLPPALNIDDADLRFGDSVRIISLTPGVEVDEQLIATCFATLNMLSGSSAGASFRLEPGVSTIGRVSTNDVTIVDPSISRHHATVTVTNSFVTLEDNGSTNGVTVAGELVSESTHIRSGEQIKLGQSEAVLTHTVEPAGPQDTSYLEIGAATTARHQGRSVALPSPPLLSDGGARRSGRLSLGRNQQKHEIELFHMMLATLTAQLEQEQQVERAVRLAETPSFSEVAHAIASRQSLWAKLAADQGGIEARIGLGQARSRNQFEPVGAGPQDLRAKLAATVERFSSVAAAPVTVDFRELGTVGIQGPIDQARALAYSMIGQLCATFGPDQLGIACRPGDMAAEWDWLKWLPHTDFVGSAAGIRDADFVSWVSALFNEENLADTGLAGRPAAILLVLDDDRPLPLAVLARLIQEGPALGIHAVLISNEAKGFDTVLGATVRVADGIASLHQSDRDPIGGIVVESCDRQLVDGLARMISPVGYREYRTLDPDDEETDDTVSVQPFRLGGAKPTILASMKRRTVVPPTTGVVEEFPAASETTQLPASYGVPATAQVVNVTDVIPEPVAMAEPPAPVVAAAAEQPAGETPVPEPPAERLPPAPVPTPIAPEAAGSQPPPPAPAVAEPAPPPPVAPPEPAVAEPALPPPVTPPEPAVAEPVAPTPIAPPEPAVAEPAPPAAPPEQQPQNATEAQNTEEPLNLTALPHPEDDSRLVLGTVTVNAAAAPAVFALNLNRDPTLGLHGGPGTGKTTALRSVAAAAGMLRVGPELTPTVYYLDVHGDLENVQAMPHVSGASKNDIIAFRSVVVAIEQLFTDRVARFEQLGVETLEEFRAAQPTESMGRVVVLADDMGVLAEMLDSLHPGRWSDLLVRLLNDGGRLGLHLMFSVDERAQVDEDLVPKVGRWLHLGIDGADGSPGRPGQANIGKAKVRFATIDGPSPQPALSPVAS